MVRDYYSLEREAPLHTPMFNDDREGPLHTLAINVADPSHTLAINDAYCCPRAVRGINMPPLPILDGWGRGDHDDDDDDDGWLMIGDR